MKNLQNDDFSSFLSKITKISKLSSLMPIPINMIIVFDMSKIIIFDDLWLTDDKHEIYDISCFWDMLFYVLMHIKYVSIIVYFSSFWWKMDILLKMMKICDFWSKYRIFYNVVLTAFGGMMKICVFLCLKITYFITFHDLFDLWNHGFGPISPYPFIINRNHHVFMMKNDEISSFSVKNMKNDQKSWFFMIFYHFMKIWSLFVLATIIFLILLIKNIQFRDFCKKWQNMKNYDLFHIFIRW